MWLKNKDYIEERVFELYFSTNRKHKEQRIAACNMDVILRVSFHKG